MSDGKIDAISSKPVFKAKLFEVDEYSISLRNGHQLTHHVVTRHPTVAVFPLSEKGEIYLAKQYRYMLKTTSLEAVAGFIDEGETPLEAAKRELKEETGIAAGTWEELVKLDMAASVFDAKVHLFLAKDLEFGEATPEEEEEIEVVKMSLSDALHKIMTGEITTSATVTGLLLLDRQYRK